MPDNENTCYVLGPMTGYFQDNRPAFREATAKLRAAGYEVISPDELDGIDPVYPDPAIEDSLWIACMERDMKYVPRAAFGVALPGWEKSRGGILEAAILRHFRRPVFALVDGKLRRIPDADLPTISIPTGIAQ